MRFLGVDFGVRRIGLALSDASGVLASPWQIVEGSADPTRAASRVATVVDALRASDDPALDGIVVGIPRRLDGRDTDQTPNARVFAAALGRATALPIFPRDERLTSHEAEARLAVRERDWRKRKAKLDAAAAAIILQDYLDERAR